MLNAMPLRRYTLLYIIQVPVEVEALLLQLLRYVLEVPCRLQFLHTRDQGYYTASA